jgi:hypothetical protein
MSQLAPAKMRLWLELWKEEVMACIPSSELQQKFQDQQVKKGRLSSNPQDGIKPKIKDGGRMF